MSLLSESGTVPSDDRGAECAALVGGPRIHRQHNRLAALRCDLVARVEDVDHTVRRGQHARLADGKTPYRSVPGIHANRRRERCAAVRRAREPEIGHRQVRMTFPACGSRCSNGFAFRRALDPDEIDGAVPRDRDFRCHSLVPGQADCRQLGGPGLGEDWQSHKDGRAGEQFHNQASKVVRSRLYVIRRQTGGVTAAELRESLSGIAVPRARRSAGWLEPDRHAPAGQSRRVRRPGTAAIDPAPCRIDRRSS